MSARAERRLQQKLGLLTRRFEAAGPADAVGQMQALSIWSATTEYGIGDGTVDALVREGIENALDLWDLSDEAPSVPQVPHLGRSRSESLARWVERAWDRANSRAEAAVVERDQIQLLRDAAHDEYETESVRIVNEVARRRTESGI